MEMVHPKKTDSKNLCIHRSEGTWNRTCRAEADGYTSFIISQQILCVLYLYHI